MGTGCDRKLIFPIHLEGERIKRKGRVLALWPLITTLTLMMNSTLLLRIGTNNLKTV